MEHVETNTLVQSLQVVRRHWLLLLLTPLVAALVGFGFAHSKSPTYQATAILLAGPGTDTVGSIEQVPSAAQAAIALGAMANDRVVLERALRELGDRSHGVSPEQLGQNTTVNVPADSQKIEVTVADRDAARAALLANAVARSFAAMVGQKTMTRFDVRAAVWQRADVPSSPVSPNVPLITFAAFVIGLLVAGALAFARDASTGVGDGERSTPKPKSTRRERRRERSAGAAAVSIRERVAVPVGPSDHTAAPGGVSAYARQPEFIAALRNKADTSANPPL